MKAGSDLVFENNRTEEIGPDICRDEWGIVWKVAGHILASSNSIHHPA